MDKTDRTVPHGERFARGVALIFQRQPDAETCAVHDKIFYGRAEVFSAEDRAVLERLGWFENEDSWAFFT